MRTRLEVVVALVAAGYVLFILTLVRGRQLREKYALLWLGVGVVAIVLSLARTTADRVANFLGISYGPSALFLFSTMFLMAVAAHLSWEVSRLEEKTRQLAEEIALLRVESDIRREAALEPGSVKGRDGAEPEGSCEIDLIDGAPPERQGNAGGRGAFVDDGLAG